MKSIVYWNIMPRSPVEVYGRFGGKRSFHFQGRRESEARNLNKAAYSRWLLLDLSFETEDRGTTLLRNVGGPQPDYAALYSRRHICLCENLKSNVTTWVSFRRFCISHPKIRRLTLSKSNLLYDWRFTANQFVLAPTPWEWGSEIFFNWTLAVIVVI
jgi:hypothetical protein